MPGPNRRPGPRGRAGTRRGPGTSPRPTPRVAVQTNPAAQPGPPRRSAAEMQVIYRRRRVAAVVLLALIFVGLFVLMASSDRTSKPMLINGDSVGRMAGESMGDYQARAEASRQGLAADEDVFALVSFEHPLSPVEAGRLLEAAHIKRVSSFILDGLPPVALPEPTGTENRADVFSAWLGRARHLGLAAEGLDGVIVYGPAGDLQALVGQPDVLAVEAAPPGAAWGRFGVQPVQRRAEAGTPATPTPGHTPSPAPGQVPIPGGRP